MTRPVASRSRSTRSASVAVVARAVRSWTAATNGTAARAASPNCQLTASITATIVSGVAQAEMNGARRCAITLIACNTPWLARTDISPVRPGWYQPMGNRARCSPRRSYMPCSIVVPTRKPERSLTYRSTA